MTPGPWRTALVLVPVRGLASRFFVELTRRETVRLRAESARCTMINVTP